MFTPHWLSHKAEDLHQATYFQGQMDNISLCKLVVRMERGFEHTTSEKYDESYTMNEFRCYEAKLKESEKAGSCQESNPRHLWLEPPMLCHWATDSWMTTRLLPLALFFFRTRNNTDGNKLMTFSGIASYYGDNYILSYKPSISITFRHSARDLQYLIQILTWIDTDSCMAYIKRVFTSIWDCSHRRKYKWLLICAADVTYMMSVALAPIQYSLVPTLITIVSGITACNHSHY